ncbi:MAG: hypothetical protein QMC66_03485 [Ascidiaceihabitans sp.]|jgi:hypothetical protein|tara:strand:- start:834 stop:959 length:126 start_codon:yes stop_codon:yes gene_type:complete
MDTLSYKAMALWVKEGMLVSWGGNPRILDLICLIPSGGVVR